jgi:hypothetical protein
VNLGPLGPVDPRTGLDAGDPLAALTDADRAWLDRMAEELPRSMPVAGSSWWLLVRVDERLFARPEPRPSPGRRSWH